MPPQDANPTPSFGGFGLRGRDDLAMGTYHSGDTLPYLVCRTKDGHWLQMGNLAVSLWFNWLKALGMENLIQDPTYRHAMWAAPEVRESLRVMLLEKMQEKTLEEWMTLFTTEYDVVCEPLLSTQEGMEHPQIIHNGNVIEVEDLRKGQTRQLGPLAAFSATPASPQGPAPDPGHTTRFSRSCSGMVPHLPRTVRSQCHRIP